MKQCGTCGKELSRLNQIGFCKSHAAQFMANNPEYRRKQVEGIRRKFKDPEYRAKMAKVAARTAQKHYADPVNNARARERGKELYRKYLSSPEARKRNIAAIRANSYKITEHWLGWCPEEFRDLHRKNVNRHIMTAAESRALIEKMVADRDALKHVDSALSYLRRLAPVQKLENGYRVGFSDVLSPSEVVRRAELQGWQPERWAA